ESFAKPDFWLKSRLSEFQKRSLLVVNEAFEILSNEELGQKAGFSKDSISACSLEVVHHVSKQETFIQAIEILNLGITIRSLSFNYFL
ncbi:MAG: hypothetical protein AAGC64_09810, partial [Bacteroidota bacterium]